MSNSQHSKRSPYADPTTAITGPCRRNDAVLNRLYLLFRFFGSCE